MNYPTFIRISVSIFMMLYSFLISVTGVMSQDSTYCDTLKNDQRNNLGLYGGFINDLTYSATNNRLFAAVTSPYSLYYSDDTANNWIPAFPVDSLEYECGNRGWGGRSLSVLTNSKGWVVSHNLKQMGVVLSSVVASFNNGDSGTWKTLLDINSLITSGKNVFMITNIGISDHYIYVLAGKYIMRYNESGVDSNATIDLSTLITWDSTYSAVSISPANSPTGYPFYVVVDTTGDSHQPKGILYKYDGTTLSEVNVSIIEPIKEKRRVFTHPSQTGGDTVIVVGIDSLSGSEMSVISYNGGADWTIIKHTSSTTGITKVQHSDKFGYTASNNMVISISGKIFSTDLGNTWESVSFENKNTTLAIQPNHDSIFAIGTQTLLKISTDGSDGTFKTPNNVGLEAVQVNKMARAKNDKNVFYLATNSGLAYTGSLLDTNIENYAKWQPPFGIFPIPEVNDSFPIYSVAVSPFDSLQVIAGSEKGFYVSHSGPTGFTEVIPNGHNMLAVNDIYFISENLVLSVTGSLGSGKPNEGKIWKSVDGGDNWTDISPSNFFNGNDIELAINNTDTAIYIASGLYFQDNLLDTGYIWKSIDLGNTWTIVNNSQITINTFGTLTGFSFTSIKAVPGTVDSLYVIAAGDNNINAFAFSDDQGVTFTSKNIPSSKVDTYSALEINQNKPDSFVYIASDRYIYSYIPVQDTFDIYYTGLPGETIPDILYGSIFTGTNVGFYGLELETIDDIIVPLILSNNNSGINIYPNPTQYNFTIACLDLKYQKHVYIQMLDLLGTVIMEIEWDFSENKMLNVNTSELSSGAYFLSVKDKDKSTVKKIIVSK